MKKWIALLGIGLLLAVGCTKQQAKQAGEGATMGAVAGAVGGLVTGLVFGGNPIESAAAGAVFGASTGATAGAISGAQQESAQKEQQRAKGEEFRKKFGDDAYNGAVALAQCKHEVALANAAVVSKDEDKDKALAGLWLEVLSHADNKQEEQARALFPAVVEKDPEVKTEVQAEEKMRRALQKLMEIRADNGLPQVCEQ
ncbi:MAG: hypothetical protein HZB24_09180 [Desulfobacterales bacterium]|nr:hypothetical protein [Desulfobacterales bacterium]